MSRAVDRAGRSGSDGSLSGGWLGAGRDELLFREGPDESLIVLRGDIDSAAVRRHGRHVEDALAARTRFVIVEAAAVDSFDPDLLELLGHTQQLLAARRALLRVRGLHPGLLPRSAATAPYPGPGHLAWRSAPETMA